MISRIGTIHSAGLVAVALLAGACHDAARGEPRGAGHGPGAGPSAPCPVDTTPLADGAHKAVERALADERRAGGTYAALDASLGPTSPFARIVRAERRHATALEGLLTRRGLPVPATEAITPPAITTRVDACKLGAASERANVALYDELLAGPLPPDVRCVFEHLRDASRLRHQPAFERCAAGP